MNAPTIIPEPDVLPLPAPVWFFKVLLYLTFLLHIIPMNLLLGGALIAAIERFRGGSETPAARMVRRLRRMMPTVIAFTVTLGVAPLLFVQVLYGHLFYTSSVIMAWPWLLVVPALIVVYYMAYGIAFRGGRPGGLPWWLIFLGAAGIAFVYVNNMTLALRPEKWAHVYFQQPGGMHGNLYDATLIPRYLHFITAALAVAGLTIATMGCRKPRSEPEDGRHWVRTGSLWFLWATGAQFVIGFWFLFALPRDVMFAFMGGHLGGTIALGASILLALGALIHVAISLNHPDPAPRIRNSAVMIVLSIIGMILVRDVMRDATLEPHFQVTSLKASPQTAVIVIFLVVLAAGLAKVGWMVSAYARSERT